MDRTVFDDRSHPAALERLDPRLLLSSGAEPCTPVYVQWRGDTVPARAIPLDAVSGGLSIAGGRVDTPTDRTVWYLFDRGNSGPKADVTDKLFGIDDLLDGVLVDVLDGPLV